MQPKVVSLGEIMMRLSPPGHDRLIQTDSFDIHFGGGEANVAIALAQYGIRSSFVSRVPDTALGQSAINHLRRYGVDTTAIARGGSRLGLYFVENGSSVRAPQVIYDRAGSAISEALTEDFDLDSIMAGADWFHTSGISPALSERAAALTEAALQAAKARGLKISIDINYRSKLWPLERARTVMSRLCRYADVCIGPDASLGFAGPYADLMPGQYDRARYEEVFAAIREEYGFQYIASTIRQSHSASDNTLSALVYDGREYYETRSYELRVVDRVGSGDAFAAGFIYGILSGMSLSGMAEYGTAAAALKHTVRGDTSHSSYEEVYALLQGDASGRIQR